MSKDRPLTLVLQPAEQVRIAAIAGTKKISVAVCRQVNDCRLRSLPLTPSRVISHLSEGWRISPSANDRVGLRARVVELQSRQMDVHFKNQLDRIVTSIDANSTDNASVTVAAYNQNVAKHFDDLFLHLPITYQANSGDRLLREAFAQRGRAFFHFRYAIELHTKEGVHLAFSPSGDHLISVTSGRDKKAKLWMGEPLKRRASFDASADAIGQAAFLPWKNAVAVATGNQVLLWDQTRHRLQRRLQAHKDLVFHLCTIASHQILISADRSGSVMRWDTAKNFALRRIRHGSRWVDALACARKAASIAVANEGKIRLINVLNGKKGLRIDSGHLRVQALKFSIDGKIIASGGIDGSIKIWSSDTGRHRVTIVNDDGWVNAVEFSPDNKLLVGAFENGLLRVWRTVDWRLVAVYEGHASAVNALAMRHQSPQLASLDNEGVIHLWNLPSY